MFVRGGKIRVRRNDMIKIVVDEKIPFLKGLLEPYAAVVYKEGRIISPDDVKDADAMIIRTRTRCDRTLLQGSKVRFIGTATIGFDHIDMEYCSRNRIKVVTAAGCNAGGVAQYVMAALAFLNADPVKHTLGIIGVGNVGSAVKEAASGMGFNVLCNDPPKADTGGEGYVSLDRLLSASDIITVHVPLNRTGIYKTENLIDGDVFAKMKNGVVFINSSRGETVDENALCKAIISRKISDAVIDVWCHEPDINRELLSLACIATPHIAGYSLQGKANGSSMVIRALADFFGLDPIKDWYPKEVTPVKHKSILEWNCFKALISRVYNNIVKDSDTLKNAPEQFENLRNDYDYRNEILSEDL